MHLDGYTLYKPLGEMIYTTQTFSQDLKIRALVVHQYLKFVVLLTSKLDTKRTRLNSYKINLHPDIETTKKVIIEIIKAAMMSPFLANCHEGLHVSV